ncbi:MAG: 2,3-bisphosphoglycerate-independent phosphoglycerate mutase [Patescibacteria group bacterium]|jgi:2,3-bisphosphoglycerate-independent phosphoglycerate mutase
MQKDEQDNSGFRPIVLAILDGWGVSATKEGNAIALAKTPHYDGMLEQCPHTSLAASGHDVGLEENQDGNSEAGHLNIGAGRIVLQDTVKISRAIDDGSFFRNPAFERAVKHVQRHNSTLHLMGLLSDNQSAHANPDHLLALLTFAKKLRLNKVVLHLFTDGRDSSRYEAIELMKKLHTVLDGIRVGSIAGRFYAMDRGHNWERIEKVYNMLTVGEGLRAKSAEEAILHAYNRDETDEFIQPTIIMPDGQEPAIIGFNDSIIFFNLRSDRARQLTKAFVQPDFSYFKRKVFLEDLVFVGMTDFGPDLNILSAFPSEDVKNTLPMVLKAYRQLYIAESEKFAHATYFFNGGYDHAVAGEDRIVIPSPQVRTYDLQPEMSTPQIVNYVVDDISREKHDFIMINFAAPDMVAHTGNLQASIKAAEAIDIALHRLEQVIQHHHGILVVSADHGNIEGLTNNQTKEVDTEHSTHPVPFILVGTHLPKDALRESGRLADIAPTILNLFGIEKPVEMTGQSLIKGEVSAKI